MTSNLRIDYVELPTRQIELVQPFYEAVFGWEFTSYGPEYVAFADGRLAGGFFISELASSTTNGAALVVIFADRLEEVRDAVLANGGKIVREIFSFPGGRRFHFADPHGNELAVWSDR